MSSSLGFTRIARIRSSRPDTKKRVDFIMELPLEIVVCYILPKVLPVFCNLPELSPCFQVCRAWNERMIPRVGNIRFFMLRNDHAWSVEDWMQVDAFTPHIKTLVINGSTPSVIWPLAERLRSPSLCDLTLQVIQSRSFTRPQDISTRRSRSRSGSRSQTLPKPLHFHHLLDQCPSLVVLKIESKETTFITTSFPDSVTYPNIRHLELRDGFPPAVYPRTPDNTRYHVSGELFKHFPRLDLLALWYPEPRPEDMQAIFRYCPLLQQLYLGGITNHLLSENSRTFQGGGLRLLSLQGTLSQGFQIVLLLLDHSTTIESLVMESFGSWLYPVTMVMKDPLSFPQLRSLHLRFHLTYHPMEFIRSVIARALNLESITFDRGGLQGDLLDDLIRLPLRKIDLICTPWSNGPSAFRFLDHHVKLRTRSTLEEIACTITDYADYRNNRRMIHTIETFLDLGGGWMLSIAALQQLRSLELLFKNEVYEESLTELLHAISQQCPALEKLTLEFHFVSFDIQWILPLAQHANLKKMTIVAKRFPNDTSTLLQHFYQNQAFDLRLKAFDIRGYPMPTCIRHSDFL